jgi:hypothetical protein
MGIQVAALAAVIAEMSTQIAVLEQQLEADFEAHPDAQVVRSLPGLGTILGARVLGESGDAPHRYATATCRKLRRHITGDPRLGQETSRAGPPRRNRRLADAIYLWAFSSITTSPGARAFYDTRRAAGDTHHQGPARPGQPPRRHPARLPDPPHPLQRAHRLASASVRQPCKPGTPRSERWQRVGLPPAQRLAGQLWISPDASKKVRHPAPRQTVCPWPASPGRFRIPSTLLRTTADSGSVTVDVT